MSESKPESGSLDDRSDSVRPTKSSADAFARVIDLQPAYSATNTPEMQQRGVIIRDEIPRLLREWLPEFEPIAGELDTEGRDGTSA